MGVEMGAVGVQGRTSASMQGIYLQYAESGVWAHHCKSDAVLNGGLRSSLTLGHADLLQLARIFRMTQPVGCERDCAALELWAGVVRVSIARFPSNARNDHFDKRQMNLWQLRPPRQFARVV